MRREPERVAEVERRDDHCPRRCPAADPLPHMPLYGLDGSRSVDAACELAEPVPGGDGCGVDLPRPPVTAGCPARRRRCRRQPGMRRRRCAGRWTPRTRPTRCARPATPGRRRRSRRLRGWCWRAPSSRCRPRRPPERGTALAGRCAAVDLARRRVARPGIAVAVLGQPERPGSDRLRTKGVHAGAAAGVAPARRHLPRQHAAQVVLDEHFVDGAVVAGAVVEGVDRAAVVDRPTRSAGTARARRRPRRWSGPRGVVNVTGPATSRRVRPRLRRRSRAPSASPSPRCRTCWARSPMPAAAP